MLKKFMLFWKNFFLLVWEVVKTMKTTRGIIALLIAYMIYHGWAVFFVVVGIISGNGWFFGIGSMVVLFWFGPGTPVIPLILVTGLFIQRYILMDKNNRVHIKEKWRELTKKNEKS